MDSSMLNKAVEYADRNWKIFPLHTAKNSLCSCGNPKCTSAAKHPKIKEWQTVCSSEPSQIKDWWSRWPDANIGLATGSASGLIVLDIDPRHGGKESLQDLVKKNGCFPKTLASSTGGGGFHLFFKKPQIKVLNRTNVLPGLDIRGEGGYVVAPPSFHQSGVQYSWTKNLSESSLCDAPDWFFDFLEKNGKTSISNKYETFIKEGGRNNFLTREAGKFRRLGLEQHQILSELKRINLARCLPPVDNNELFAICASVSRYPSAAVPSGNIWEPEPRALVSKTFDAPSFPSELLPEALKPWIMDISDRMQVPPEFVVAPALVSFSSIVGRKIGIHPKQQDDWLVVPNLWGAIVARPGYFKSPTIAEAMKPLEMLSERARNEYEANRLQANSSQIIASMQLEGMRERVKKAVKDGNYDELPRIKSEIEELERETQASQLVERRYKTNDATVEKIARLLNENPNGMLLLRDELNGWLQVLNKPGREGDREFFLEAWNGYSSYSVDRVGSGSLRVPALCLSIFGGIQPGKLQSYVERAIQGGAEDDGLLQRFQLLIYPDLSSEWTNVDKYPDLTARESVYTLFNHIDGTAINSTGAIPAVRFGQMGQEAFNTWRVELEKRLRLNEIGCAAFESHLAKYRSLMPSLALLFWILENPENIGGTGQVSFDATMLAIKWCEFLEKHALKAYQIGQSTEWTAARKFTECIKRGQIINGSTVRSIYRTQYAGLSTPHLVDQAIEILEELGWLRVTYESVQGGRTKKILLHPKFSPTTKKDFV